MNEQDKWGPIVHLREIAIPTDAMRVDRDSSVIHGVRVLGPSSLNGRQYSSQAIQKAASLYENRPVNVDHSGSQDGGQRRVSDRFGWLKNVRFANAGLEADLHFLKSHPQAESVVEAAERNPALFGLSHNADGRMTRNGSQYIVEEIVGVRSVDLVADPATTKSLFESLQLKEESMDPLDAPAVGPTGGETFDLLVGKLRSVWDGDGDASAKAGQMNKIVRTLLKLEDQLADEPEPEPEPEPESEPEPEDKPTPESVQPAAITALESQIAKLTEQIVALQDAAKAPVVRPRSGVIRESVSADGYVKPKDAAELARRLKSRL